MQNTVEQRTAEYIRKLQLDTRDLQSQVDTLKAVITMYKNKEAKK